MKTWFLLFPCQLMLLLSCVSTGKKIPDPYEHAVLELHYKVSCETIAVADRIVYNDFEGVQHVLLNVPLPFEAEVQTRDYERSQDPLVRNDLFQIVVTITKKSNPLGGDLLTLATLGSGGRSVDKIHHNPGTFIYQTGLTNLTGECWVNDFSNIWGQNETR